MKKIKSYILNNKIGFIGISLLTLIFMIFLIWSNFNYESYKSTIVKVISVEETFKKVETGPNDRKEEYYEQIIKGEVKNGEYKGQTISLINEYSSSILENERYRKGDDLFVDLKSSDNNLTGSINGMKRDKFIIALLGIFIILIIAIAGKLGVCTLATLAINIITFIYFINLYIKGKDFTLINFWMILIFTVTTLIVLGGISRKNISAILSTLTTTYLIYGLYILSVKYLGEVHYEFIDNIAGPKDIENIFLSGIIIGSLGAIMDVSITINSTVNELINVQNSISISELIKSIREVGYDVMGTMVNVLMFSYIGGTLSILILKIINNYTLLRLIQFDLSFEVIRFLIGAIGIVSAIPISGVISIMFLKRWRIKA